MWPPEWAISDQGLGEAGVLEAVHLRTDLTPKLINVVASHLGTSGKGVWSWKTRSPSGRLRPAQTACGPAAHRNRRFGDKSLASDAEARPQTSAPPRPAASPPSDKK